MRKAEKNDLDFREMKSRFDSAFLEQVEQIKTLIKERELLRLYIKRLEKENASLTAINRSDQTVQLITRAAVVPTSFEVNQQTLHRFDRVRANLLGGIGIG